MTMSSFAHPRREEQQPSDVETIVLGVDTHKNKHVAAVITTTGVLVEVSAFPATADGYRHLLAWARRHGRLRRAGVEGTNSYGAALSRFLLSEGIDVIEVNWPDKAARRRRGKTDALDAEHAARAVLGGDSTARAKTTDGPVEMIRMFRLARLSALKARTQATNQLKAVLVNADPQLRTSLTGLGPKTMLRRCIALAPDTMPEDVDSAAAHTLSLLASRILALTVDIERLRRHIESVIQRHWPQLLQRNGIGPDSAAALLITAGDNPDRLTSAGAFVALCGASPVDASSGNSQRRRLNRGGDRQANAALYRIVISRLHTDPATRAYRDRRRAEGKTKREIIRCLKRYVAREVFGLLTPHPAAIA
jgi:transposase